MEREMERKVGKKKREREGGGKEES